MTWQDPSDRDARHAAAKRTAGESTKEFAQGLPAPQANNALHHERTELNLIVDMGEAHGTHTLS